MYNFNIFKLHNYTMIIAFSKKLFNFTKTNNFSTDKNINRHNRLLEKYYKRKINECLLCNENNKCKVIDLYKIRFESDAYILNNIKSFNCLYKKK